MAVVIKKYGNRRLYDTSASRYVNLDDIASMVRNGTDLQVVDALSGEDLTRVTLTQIIVEDAKGQPTGLPLELLRQLIMASNHVGQEFIMWYLKSAFDAYQKVQNAVQSGITEVQSATMAPIQMMKQFLQPASKADQKSTINEVEELRKRLADLESRLRDPHSMKQKKRGASRKRRSTAKPR